MSSAAFAWVVVSLFVVTGVATRFTESVAVAFGIVAWASFAVFWARWLPVFAVEMHAPMEAVLAGGAMFACLLVGYRLFATRSIHLFRLTDAIAVTGVVYLLAATVPGIRTFLVETVAAHTHAVIVSFGFDPQLLVHERTGLRSELQFHTGGAIYTTYLVFACTGIGAMATFTGLIVAAPGSLSRRAGVLAIGIPVLWVLNVARNVFIAIAFGKQWLQVGVTEVLAVTSYTDPGMVSYLIADRVIAQSLSIVAIGVVTVGVVTLLPRLGSTGVQVIDVLLGGRLSPDRVTNTRDDGGVNG